MKFKKGDYLISKGGSEVLHKIIRCNKITYRVQCVYNPHYSELNLPANVSWAIQDIPGSAWTNIFEYVDFYYKKYPKLKGKLYEIV